MMPITTSYRYRNKYQEEGQNKQASSCYTTYTARYYQAWKFCVILRSRVIHHAVKQEVIKQKQVEAIDTKCLA